MSRDLNKWTAIGRLTGDAEFKIISTGKELLSFSIASNYGEKEGQVSFFQLRLWGKLAVSLREYMKKGKQVAVEGRPRQERWQSDGRTNSKVVFDVDSVQLLGGGERHIAAAEEPPIGDMQGPDLDAIPF